MQKGAYIKITSSSNTIQTLLWNILSFKLIRIIFEIQGHTLQKTLYVSSTKSCWLILFREIIVVYTWAINTEHINTPYRNKMHNSKSYDVSSAQLPQLNKLGTINWIFSGHLFQGKSPLCGYRVPEVRLFIAHSVLCSLAAVTCIVAPQTTGNC